MRKLLIPVLFIVLSFTGCSKPKQWKEKDADSHLSFITFNRDSTVNAVADKFNDWNVDYTVKPVSKNCTVYEIEWLTYEKVEYSIIFLYFNEKEKLFRIRAEIPGEANGKTLLKKMNKKFTETRRRSQLPAEHYYKGKDKETAALKFNKNEEVYYLEIELPQ